MHCITDALSWAPVFSAPADNEAGTSDGTIRMVVATDPNLAELMNAADEDEEY